MCNQRRFLEGFRIATKYPHNWRALDYGCPDGLAGQKRVSTYLTSECDNHRLPNAERTLRCCTPGGSFRTNRRRKYVAFHGQLVASSSGRPARPLCIGRRHKRPQPRQDGHNLSMPPRKMIRGSTETQSGLGSKRFAASPISRASNPARGLPSPVHGSDFGQVRR